MRKVLIITYYWPPSGGAGVQRWLKFVKYLHQNNWEPIVYTPENPEVPETDLSLSKDIPDYVTVIKRPVWEPYTYYKKLLGMKPQEKIQAGFLSESEKPRKMQELSVWIRGNLFIPDARKFWVTPSVKFLKNHLSHHPVQAMITTGPPHSMHLIGRALKKSLNIPWLADFRDPWTNIDFYHELKLTRWADQIHHKLEQSILQRADRVTVISPTMANEFKTIHNRRYDVLTNGFDTEDYTTDKILLDKKFTIAHIGSLNKARNPETLWQVLEQMTQESTRFSKDLLIRLIGKVDHQVIQSINQYHLDKHVEYVPYMPHNQIVKVQQQTQLLLLCINQTPNAKGILTGKLFEYMGSRRPIFCIGPCDGDAAEIINKSSCGWMADYHDATTMTRILADSYLKFSKQSLNNANAFISPYSREKLTERLAGILHGMTS